MTNGKYEIIVNRNYGYLFGFAVALLIINLSFLANIYKDMDLQLFIINDKLSAIKTILATAAVDNESNFRKVNEELREIKKIN